MKKALITALSLLLAFVLPFVILIRGTNLLRMEAGWPFLPSIIVSALVTSILLFIYISLIYGKITGHWGKRAALKGRLYFTLFVVLAFTIHGITFISTKQYER